MKKIFTFGDGGVLVDASWTNGYIKLTQIKPPTGYIGTIKKEDLEKAELLYSVKISKKDNEDLLKLLRSELKSLKGSSTVIMDDCILDFSNYNEKSVKVVLNAIDDALRGCLQLALAC